MIEKYKELAKQEHSTRKQVLTLAAVGPVIVVAIPLLIVWAAGVLDRGLGLPRLNLGAGNAIAGAALIAVGAFLGLWSVVAEITIGQGTPVPLAPTKKLVVRAPFTYCRNPMTLGTFILYLGICAWLGSLSAAVIVVLLTGLLLVYIKLVEEKELAARFGEEYLAYKQDTPFILPRLRRPGRKN